MSTAPRGGLRRRRVTRAHVPAVAFVALLVLVACQETAEGPVSGPTTARAAVVIEPPHLEIADAAWVEIAVITPPDWKVPPVPIPSAVDGLWILDVERTSVAKEPSRWIHTTRIRVRARAVGGFRWPAAEIRIDDGKGQPQTLVFAERPFEVHSVLDQHPEQRGFFSFRGPAPANEGGSPWIPALVGAGLAFGLVGLVALVRRGRAAAARQDAEVSAGAAPWRATQATLAAALEIAAREPVRAADIASGALRLYVDRRYRADTLTATTEELALRDAPFALGSHWPKLLEILVTLDSVRFEPAGSPGAAARLQEGLAAAQEFVVQASPQGNWR